MLQNSGVFLTEAAAILRLAVPVTLTHWAWLAMGTTDIIMIAWLSPEALAAGSLAQTYYAFFVFVFSGVLSGCLPIMSQARGAFNHGDMNVTLRQTVLLSFVISAVAYAAVWQADVAIRIADQSAAVAELGAQFIRISALAIPAVMIVNIMRSFATACGKPRLGLMSIALCIILNAALNYVLMFGQAGLPRLELLGAAWSSVVSYWLLLALLSIAFTREPRFHARVLFRGSWRVDVKVMRHILSVGVPIGIMLLSETGIFFAAAFVIGHFGVAQVGGNAIALEFARIAFAVPLGLQQATIVRVGWAVGAFEMPRVRLAAVTAVAVATVVGIASALTIWYCNEAVVRLMVVPSQAANTVVADAALSIVAVVAVYQVIDIPQMAVCGALRGMKDIRWPMWVFLPSFWIFGAGLSLIFGFGLGWQAQGVWIGLSFGTVLTLVILGWRLYVQLTEFRFLQQRRVSLTDLRHGR